FAAFCCTDSLGRPLCQAALHRDVQDFLGRHPRALVELPRDHGKSVQVCIRILWELGHRPGLRVKVVCASDALAVERCRFLRDAVTHNDRLPLVFPELRPEKPWGVTRFTLQRPGHVIGPSVTAVGVGTVSTGSRADLLICDDIVDVRALRSRADRERVKAYFHENLMNLLEPDGRFWGLFTPWHTDDLNSNLKHNPAYALFRRPVGDDLEPVWPEKWPRQRLEERRRAIGTLSFARGYRLQCVPDDDVLIKPAWLRYWTPDDPPLPAGERAPSGLPLPAGERAGVRGAYEQVILSVDPAVSCKSSADRTAVVALGKTATNEVHC